MTDWIKASMSGDQGACVEQRSHEGMIEVRDSKNRLGPVLSFTRAEFSAWLDGARAGRIRSSSWRAVRATSPSPMVAWPECRTCTELPRELSDRSSDRLRTAMSSLLKVATLAWMWS